MEEAVVTGGGTTAQALECGEHGAIWLYDGVCVLCSGAVHFMLRHERDHMTRFVAIQSGAGRRLAQMHGVDADNPETFLFIEDGQAHAKSDGVLALIAHLNGPARLLLLGKYLPRPARDWLYDRIARNRYRIFGRKETCEVPHPNTGFASRCRMQLHDETCAVDRRYRRVWEPPRPASRRIRKFGPCSDIPEPRQSAGACGLHQSRGVVARHWHSARLRT